MTPWGHDFGLKDHISEVLFHRNIKQATDASHMRNLKLSCSHILENKKKQVDNSNNIFYLQVYLECYRFNM